MFASTNKIAKNAGVMFYSPAKQQYVYSRVVAARPEVHEPTSVEKVESLFATKKITYSEYVKMLKMATEVDFSLMRKHLFN